MLKDRENILNALREKPLKVYELMRRANLPNEEACQSLLLKMRDEGLVKFESTRGYGSSDSQIQSSISAPFSIDLDQAGNLSPNIGRPLRDCSRVVSSWMTSQCSASTPSSMRTMSATTHAAGWPIPLNRPWRMTKSSVAAAMWFS